MLSSYTLVKFPRCLSSLVIYSVPACRSALAWRSPYRSALPVHRARRCYRKSGNWRGSIGYVYHYKSQKGVSHLPAYADYSNLRIFDFTRFFLAQLSILSFGLDIEGRYTSLDRSVRFLNLTRGLPMVSLRPSDSRRSR